jgi:Family of unknown function (DUF6491)
MRFFTLALILPALALAGCAADPDRPARAQQTMVPVGPPQNCVDTVRIRSTTVIDDQTIDFRMTDGTVFRNTLPNRCPGLGFERAFSYSTSINRLCNVDIITVLNQGGGIRRGASCGLGMFVPVKPADAQAAG